MLIQLRLLKVGECSRSARDVQRRVVPDSAFCVAVVGDVRTVLSVAAGRGARHPHRLRVTDPVATRVQRARGGAHGDTAHVETGKVQCLRSLS